jgi:hypothetical protein
MRISHRDMAHGLLIAAGEEDMTMARHTTLLDLVKAVSLYASTDAEVVATVVHMVNSGMVQLCGNFRGARFDLESAGVKATAA